jgi:RNA polymerase sigma-70 factor (ECF subfamily)
MPSDPVAPADESSTRPAGLSRETRERFHGGDVDALGEVYDRYARAAWALALSLTGVEHLAQEAVQEAFVRAWRSAGAYDPARDLGSWLLTVTRHATLDLLRRELRPTRGGHEAEQDTAVEEPGMDGAWLAWAVQEALGQLAEHEREIVRLSFYDDLTQAQIAERTGLPLGTVKSRSHRAHRRLAGLLAHVREDATESGNRQGGPGRTPVADPDRPKEERG